MCCLAVVISFTDIKQAFFISILPSLYWFYLLSLCSSCLYYLLVFLTSVQLMFGRFGQVVEKKKSITLQDISAVRDLSICASIYLSASL